MKAPNSWVIFGLILLVFIIFTASLLALTWPVDEFSISKSGVFGDSFGVLSSLFNGLALGALILTLIQQKDEFKLQHFENILFEMIKLHVDLTTSIDLKKRDKETKEEFITVGRDCFKPFYERLIDALKYQEDKHPEKSKEQRFEDAYNHFWSTWHKELGHYFRSLYTIFKYINDSEIKDKKKYANIVRSQLSDYELLVLFYNCISKHGEQKFKPLATDFEIFNNLQTSKLFKPEDKNYYPAKAFGE